MENIEELNKKNKLYLGSGLWKRNGWYNHYTSKSIWYNNITKINYSKNYGEINHLDNSFKYDIDLDCTEKQKFPLNDSSLEVVYTSHMIEHLTNDHVEFLFKDVYRLLKKDGVFRIMCPDIDLIYDELIIKKKKNIYAGPHTDGMSAYSKFFILAFHYFSDWKLNKKELVDEQIYKEFLNIKKINEDEFTNMIKTYGKYGCFEYLKELSLPYFEKYKYHLTGFHINWFNKHKVIDFLLKAGFTKIFIKDKNKSIVKEFEEPDFDYNLPHISLFIEAIK